MTAPRRPSHPDYRHGLLVYDTDDQLVEETCVFVAEGAGVGWPGPGPRHPRASRPDAPGARHPPPAGVRVRRGALLEPTHTLFAYQRRLAESAEPSEFWVTGTVPLGHDAAAQAAWNRYESAVDEALAAYPFRALCTYDTRTGCASVIAAARATHSTVGTPDELCLRRVRRPGGVPRRPLAQVPTQSTRPATVSTTVTRLDHLRWPAAFSRRALVATARCRGRPSSSFSARSTRWLRTDSSTGARPCTSPGGRTWRL